MMRVDDSAVLAARPNEEDLAAPTFAEVDAAVAAEGNPPEADAEPAAVVQDPAARRRLIRRRVLALCALMGAVVAAGLLRTDRLVRVEGRLGPRRWAQIRPEAAGEVRTRLKSEGDSVHAGDGLAILEGDGDAVTVAELDLAQARQGLERVRSVTRTIAEYSLCVPPPEVLDLAVWLEKKVLLQEPAPQVAAGAAMRMDAIRRLVSQRAGQLLEGRAAAKETPGAEAPGGEVRQRDFAAAVERAGARVLLAVRAAADRRDHGALDESMARYEDAIFEGLGDLGGIPVLAVRDAFGARKQDPSVPSSQGLGYFELRMHYRVGRLELRRAAIEAASLARVKTGYPAIAGERAGELETLRRLLPAFVASAGDAHGGAGWKQDEARAEIGRVARAYAAGLGSAMKGIEPSTSPGLAELEHGASALSRRGPASLDRALGRLLEVRGFVQQGLVVSAELQNEVALAERQVGDFFDSAEAVRLSARELIGKRLADSELELIRQRNAVDIAHEQLREAMAFGSGAANGALPEVRRGSKGQLAVSESDRQELEAVNSKLSGALVKAEHALRAAQLAADAQVVRSPVDGVITSLRLRERDAIGRNEVVGVIEDLSGLVFKGLVADKDFARLALDQPARLSIEVGGSQLKAGGKVVWIAPAGHLVEKESQSWNVLVALAPFDPALMPALKGHAEIVVARPRGFEWVREWLRGASGASRGYLTPEVPDPTQVAASKIDAARIDAAKIDAAKRDAPQIDAAKRDAPQIDPAEARLRAEPVAAKAQAERGGR